MISHKLSFLKSLIWRIMGVIVLAAVTYFFTRHWITTSWITTVHHTTFLLVFYLHDRAWLGIKGWLKDYYTLNESVEKRIRVIKAITYEIILGMGFGGLIVFIFTGQFSKVTQITGTYTVIKLIMYYINEKVWSKIENK